MPLSLPAAMEPLEGVAAEVRQGEERAVLRYGPVRIHLFGSPQPDADELGRSIAGAADLSAALRALASAYYRAGYPAAQLWYAQDGDDLYVRVTPGEVLRVDLPEPLGNYFADLPAGPLTDDEFEPRRALASRHADRAGLDVQPIFVALPAGGYALDMKRNGGRPDRTAVQAGINNQGGRFVGRYFFDARARQAFRSGDEITLGWRTALTGIDNGPHSNGYDEFGAGWNRVTPRGVFGLSARLSKYQFGLSAGGTQIPAQTDTRQIELGWLYPVAADFRRRWTLNAALDYSFLERSAEGTAATPLAGGLVLPGGIGGASGPDGVLLDQELAAIRIGAAINRSWRTGLGTLEVDTGAQLRHGLGEDRGDDPQTRADLGYWLVRPHLDATLAPGDGWKLQAEARAQLSGDTLPEESQWVLGGVESLRAWLPGVAVGDSGGLVRIEAKYLELESWPGTRIVPGVFVEYGTARLVDPQPDSNADGTVMLADVGLQIEFEIGSWLEATVSEARVLERDGLPASVLDAAEADLMFRLTVEFF